MSLFLFGEEKKESKERSTNGVYIYWFTKLFRANALFGRFVNRPYGGGNGSQGAVGARLALPADLNEKTVPEDRCTYVIKEWIHRDVVSSFAYKNTFHRP